MLRTLNRVMLIGNVGKEPDLNYTPSGIPVASFRIATTETWRDKDNKVLEHTDWHTVVAWRRLAEIVHKIIRRGSRVYVEGRLRSRTFDDKSGIRRHYVEVLADNILLLDVRKPSWDEPTKKSIYEEPSFDGTAKRFNSTFDDHISELDPLNRIEDMPF